MTANRNPDSFIKHLGVVGHGQGSESGELEFVGAAMDVTAAKEAEERIRQNERELRITLEAIPTSVLRTLPDGAVDFVNQSWLDYLGCSREEILGWGWMKTVHPEDIDKLLNNWEEALATGEPLEIEARFRRADGKYRWFLNRTVPLRDEKGNIAIVVCDDPRHRGPQTGGREAAQERGLFTRGAETRTHGQLGHQCFLARFHCLAGVASNFWLQP